MDHEPVGGPEDHGAPIGPEAELGEEEVVGGAKWVVAVLLARVTVAAHTRTGASPSKLAVALEDEIVELRKFLAEEGLDAGASTIAYHLAERHGQAACRPRRSGGCSYCLGSGETADQSSFDRRSHAIPELTEL